MTVNWHYQLPEGSYDQIRLIVDAAEKDTNNNGKSYIEYKNGDTTNLKIPSGMQTGLKIPHEFKIKSGVITRLIADISVKEMMHTAGNSGKVILHPTRSIDIIPTIVSGDVTGRVFADTNDDGTIGSDEVLTDPNYDVNVKAYQDGDLIKSTVATIEDLDTDDDGTVDKAAGSYLLRGLEKGDYTIKAKVTEENADGEMVEATNSNGEALYQLPNPKTVTVKAKEETTINLKLNKNTVQ
jgi:hypothetical protein